MKTHLSLEQRLWNAWSVNECERLHGIHQLCMHNNGNAEDYLCIWDHSDQCAWGFMWGWLVGPQELSYAHMSSLLADELNHDRLTIIKRPELASVRPCVQAYTEYNELNSGVFEVADDGKSCRSSQICTGTCYIPYCPDDDTAYNLATTERYATDYIYDEKDKRWKYLHELVCVHPAPREDFDTGNVGYDAYKQFSETGEPYTKDSYAGLGGPPRSGRKTQFGVGIPSVVLPVQKAIYPPEPYKTFGWPNSYLPPDVKKEEVFFKDADGNWTYSIESCNDDYYTRTIPAGEFATASTTGGGANWSNE